MIIKKLTKLARIVIIILSDSGYKTKDAKIYPKSPFDKIHLKTKSNFFF